MSGHSKFANIKHKKEKNDAAKGKIFTKIGRELAVAVKEGGGADPANNSRLRDVIAKAKANNMPNDTIERNIKKAAGEGAADNYEHITYEGYGPGGTAIIVRTLTDNKNRTASNVRNAFTKGSGNVGTPGCVSFMFDEKGQIFVAKEDCSMDADELMMLALDAGADDFNEDEESYEILTTPEAFSDVRLQLEEAGIEISFEENFTDKEVFPNTVDIYLTGEDGDSMSLRGESIGGGNAVITRLNGVEVELTGNYCTMVVQHVDKKGTLAFVTTVLSAYDLNIGSLRLYRESRGKIAYAIIELDANVPEQVVNALKGIDAVINVLLVPAIHLD